MARLLLHYDWTPLLGTIERHVLMGMDQAHWPALFPNTLKQVEQLARTGAGIWREKATQLPGQEGRPLRIQPYVALSIPQYAASIVDQPNTDDPAGLGYVIGSAEEQAPLIEEGTPDDQRPMDLHLVLGTAPKARRNKQGKRYLRIPFRHATTAPGGPAGQRFQGRPSSVLPPAVVKAMQHKRRYLVTSRYQEPSIHPGGGVVTRFRYTKPDPLTMDELTALNTRAHKYTLSSEQVSRLAGLLKTGQKGHSQYLTIRTLSESNPRGWRVKGYTPKRLAESVAQEMERLVADGTYFQKAMEADAQHISRMVGAA